MALRQAARGALPAIVLSIVAALVLAGCSLIPGVSPDPRAQVLQTLAARESQWQALGIADYEFVVQRQCFCPADSGVHVTVRAGQTLSAFRDGMPVPGNELQWIPTTIPAAFALIRTQATTGERDATVEVEYDAARGFPTRISVDPIPNAIDDEYAIVISELVVGALE